MTATLQQILDSLLIPAAFTRHDKITDPAVLSHLYAWKSTTEPLLNRLDSLDFSAFSVSELAGLVGVLAPLTAVAPWSSATIRSLASACLARIPVSVPVITHIMTLIVKPLFAPTPHPRLHTSTARILSYPADVQDTYVEQPWKEYPGLDEVIYWCLVNTESSTYQIAWPLFLPPTMSFLDDYQVPYKILGVRLLSGMLSRVPLDLLLRTGVDTLVFTSLINSLSHLGDKSTPDFIRSAVTTTLQLIDFTTPSMYSTYSLQLHGDEVQRTPATTLTQTLSISQSKSLSTRFSRLSTLLSSSLLGTVITYTPAFLPPAPSSMNTDPFANSEREDTDSNPVPELKPQVLTRRRPTFNPTLLAMAQSLPLVLTALGIGGARFLKGVIPVLAEWLSMPLSVVTAETGSAPEEDASPEPDITLQLASLSSLSVLFHTCSPRIGGWSTTIVDALARCWVGCIDIDKEIKNSAISRHDVCVLKKQLKETIIQLSRVHSDVIKIVMSDHLFTKTLQNEYSILLAQNKTIFEELVGEI